MAKKVVKKIKKTKFKRYYMRRFENISINDAVEYLRNINELKEISKWIMPLEKVYLAYGGANIDENYQIFTPEFIVKDMVSAIGNEIVADNTKNVFEPTSGDGAFTTYILKLRLEEALKDRDTFLANMLRSLSTIYSVEMDNTLMTKQRCNIYTLIINFLKENNIEIDLKMDELIKYMISANFIWGMTNIENEVFSIFSSEVVYKMPVKKGYYEAIEFPVWKITDDLNISLHYEEVEQ